MTADPFHLIVLIVGYRNADDIDRCLKSLARSRWPTFSVYICENGRRAAYDQLIATVSGPGQTLQAAPDVHEPANRKTDRFVTHASFRFSSRDGLVHIGLAKDNFGYGGGVNAWLEQMIGRTDWDAALILNPDTEVHPDCLTELIAKSREGFGMVGGTLVFENEPNEVISYGLRWARLSGRMIAVGRHRPAGSEPSSAELDMIDAISGACVLVTRQFVEDVGLMAEDYFLYMEDLDWGRRRGRHRIGFAAKAVTQHVGGTTIGSGHDSKTRSPLSIYLSERNRILYAKRFAGWLLLNHFAIGLLYALRYSILAGPSSGKMAMLGLRDGLRGLTGAPKFPLTQQREHKA
ncbi:MAG TPA: glycosyltransferase [Xanthobacteraceae bacterium]|nr:glycosyltransferase [Xanthobacteraceae bacterium]